MIAGFHWWTLVLMYCAPLAIVGLVLTEREMNKRMNKFETAIKALRKTK